MMNRVSGRFHWCPSLGLMLCGERAFSLCLVPQTSIRLDLSCFVFPAFSFLFLLILRKPWYKSEKLFLSTRITQPFPTFPKFMCIQDRKDPISPLLEYDSQIYENV